MGWHPGLEIRICGIVAQSIVFDEVPQHIHAEAVDVAPEPKAHHVINRLAHAIDVAGKPVNAPSDVRQALKEASSGGKQNAQTSASATHCLCEQEGGHHGLGDDRACKSTLAESTALIERGRPQRSPHATDAQAGVAISLQRSAWPRNAWSRRIDAIHSAIHERVVEGDSVTKAITGKAARQRRTIGGAIQSVAGSSSTPVRHGLCPAGHQCQLWDRGYSSPHSRDWRCRGLRAFRFSALPGVSIGRTAPPIPAHARQRGSRGTRRIGAPPGRCLRRGIPCQSPQRAAAARAFRARRPFVNRQADEVVEALPAVVSGRFTERD